MSVGENFDSILEEIKKVYSFLTEGEPTPDDEIEARDLLIRLFNDLKNENSNDELLLPITNIIDGLNNWDTLELWFSETSLPNEMSIILNVPEPKSQDLDEISEESELDQVTPKEEEPEIDLTDIFNRVSEQFKGEIDNLKGKIDDLKRELEKKDETLKQITEKKKPQKIIPKREVRLAPPKIKIPVIKKPVLSPKPKKNTIINEPEAETEIEQISESEPEPEPEPEKKIPPVLKPVELTPIQIEPKPNELTPIPNKPGPTPPIVEEKELTPIPKTMTITPIVIEEESEDIPIITEKRVTTPVFREEKKETEEQKTPFSVEKPKITSVSIEEIETETIQSTSSDLFNVFSSVGKSKDSISEEVAKTNKVKTEEKQEEKKVLQENSHPISNATSFINFNDSKAQVEEENQHRDIEELSTDKDALYQELIALEGRRYSLEKNFKDLERGYNKGSISDSEYKNKNNKLKSQLDEITTRINSIRRLISSL
jgi:hypothetical protein